MDAPSSFCSVLEGRCPHAPPPHPLSAAVQICKWICPGGRAGWARINSPLSLQGEGDALASMSPFLSPLINQKGRPAGRGGRERMRSWRRRPAEAGGSRLSIQYLKASPRVCCAEIGAAQGKAISPPRTRVGEGGGRQEAPARPEAGAGAGLTGPSAAGLPPTARARLQDGRGSPGGGCVPVVLRGLLQPCEVHSHGDSQGLAPPAAGGCAGTSGSQAGPRWPERPQLLARDAGTCPGEGRAEPVIRTSSGELAGRGKPAPLGPVSQSRAALLVWGWRGPRGAGTSGVSRSPPWRSQGSCCPRGTARHSLWLASTGAFAQLWTLPCSRVAPHAGGWF